MLVRVLDKRGKPLLTCSLKKARRLLKYGQVKIIRKSPLVVQLLDDSGIF